MARINIVGAGVMGTVIGHALLAHGHDVTWFDDAREGRATPASAGIVHPKWTGAFDRTELQAGLQLLRESWHTTMVPFYQPKNGQTVKALCLSPTALIVPEDRLRRERVEKVGNRYVMAHGTTHVGITVVTAGAWCNELLHNLIPRVDPMAGTAFLVRGVAKRPLIQEWAPYKQMMLFQQGPERVWLGDGTAIKAPNYTVEREQESLTRLRDWARLRGPAQAVRGFRPVVRGSKAGLYQQTHSHAWVCSGGGKNSTVFSAICALRLLKELR